MFGYIIESSPYDIKEKTRRLSGSSWQRVGGELFRFAGFLGGISELSGQFGELLLAENESERGNNGDCDDNDDVFALHGGSPVVFVDW